MLAYCDHSHLLPKCEQYTIEAPMNILIVDDSEPIRSLLKNYLVDYHTIEAANGEEAIGQVQRFKFDLIFLDYELPGLNGIQIAGLIRRIDPTVVIVIISGNMPETAAKQAHNDGYEVLRKPFSLAAIGEIVEREKK